MPADKNPLDDLAPPGANPLDGLEPPAPPEKEGFWHSLAASITDPKRAAGLIAGAVSPLAVTAAGFGATNAEANDPQAQEAAARMLKAHSAAARNEFHNGNYLAAARHLQDAFLGGDSGMLGTMEDKIGSGDFGGAAGEGLGAAVQALFAHGVGNVLPAKIAALHAAKIAKLPANYLNKALSPHAADTSFPDHVDSTAQSIKQGAQTTGPIVDVPSARAATRAAMEDDMAALSAHKENARRTGATLDPKDVRAEMYKGIPAGLEKNDPEEYARVMADIKGHLGTNPLSVDDVFDQAHLSNGRLSRYHASPEANQNSKFTTNQGDTAVLAKEGDAYRKWIRENIGDEAADLNAAWGRKNGVDHYLAAKTNPAIRQESGTLLGGLTNPTSANGVKHGIVSNIANRMIGDPTTINGLLKAAFEHVQPGVRPVPPVIIAGDGAPSGLRPHPLDSGVIRNPARLLAGGDGTAPAQDLRPSAGGLSPDELSNLIFHGVKPKLK